LALPAVLNGHTEAVTAALFPPSGRTLVSASADRTVRVWHLDRGGADVVLTQLPAECTALALAADGTTLAAADRRGTVRLLDLSTGQLLREDRYEHGAWGLAFGGGERGTTLYVTDDKGATATDLATGSRQPGFLNRARSMRPIAVGPGGEWIAAGTSIGSIFTRSMRKPVAHEVVWVHKGPVQSLAMAPDGKQLASVGSPPESGVKILNVDGTTAGVSRANHPGGATAVAWSPDGRAVASAGVDGAVLLWDPANGAVVQECRGHERAADGGAVTCLAFSPDGRTLASCGGDRTVRLWDVGGVSGPPGRPGKAPP
jgi:WD40 repeat protein